MTIDSDTFVRFVPLARRLPQLYEDKKVNPREDPVLIGRMGSHLTYFLSTVPDGNKDPNEEDEYVKGPWFSYPAGIGYMLRYALDLFLTPATLRDSDFIQFVPGEHDAFNRPSSSASYSLPLRRRYDRSMDCISTSIPR